MKKRRINKLLTLTDRTGLLFVLPFIIGFIWLFMKPLLESLVYTFHKVTIGADGLEMEYIGWENYRYLLFSDAEFIKRLISLCAEMGVKILVIMFVSMFIAILLNDKFPGRLAFRTILFLPVIFASDRVMDFFNFFGGEAQLTETSNSFLVISGEMTGFVQEIIESFGFLSPVIEAFTVYASSIFELMWSMGLQIILFIIGLQAIPRHLYEVAEIEGATKWETFWKITFPLLMPSILLCLIYTTIDYFNSATNPIVKIIDVNMATRLDYACTQSWVYSLFLFIFVLVINGIVSRKIISLD